jgi:hypothetical protein
MEITRGWGYFYGGLGKLKRVTEKGNFPEFTEIV